MYRIQVIISVLLWHFAGYSQGISQFAPNSGQQSTFPSPTGLAGMRQEQQQMMQQQNQALRNRATGTGSNRDAQLRELRQEMSAGERGEQARINFMATNQAQYKAAFQSLLQMLQKEQLYDLQRAIFITENTFLANQLDYETFCNQISQLATLCRQLAADSLHPSPGARFLALHRLMTDTVQLRSNGLQHLPPTYDFEDFWGREDYTKQFVTKLLRTNSGQCRSLPLLYKLLADQLGIATYLSLAPNHLYIQVKDNRGEMYSYEATNGHFVSDAYYLGSGYIKAGALKNRSYLDTLSRPETLAFCLFDLTQSYAYRYGFDAFTEQCITSGLRYYPQSVQGRMLAHDAAFTKFAAAWQLAGRPPRAELPQHPALQPLFEEVQRLTRAVDELGHEDMPAEQYAQWLRQVDAEKNRAIDQQSTRHFEQSAR